MRKIDTLVIHHSATAAGSVEQFDREHRARGFRAIGYHAVIGNGRGQGDGLISEGRPDDEEGAAVFGANAGKLHVCLVGYFHTPGFSGPPTRAQLDTLGRWLLAKSYAYAGRFARPPLSVAGHHEVALKTHPTACPGSEFPIEAVRRWFEHYAATWRLGDIPEWSLGAFIAKGGDATLLDEGKKIVERPKALRVEYSDGLSADLPRTDWEIRHGQAWVRLRPFCGLLGAEVTATDDGPVVRVKS